jgi:hypothetical protein
VRQVGARLGVLRAGHLGTVTFGRKWPGTNAAQGAGVELERPVLIVSRNTATAGGLRVYFEHFGVPSTVTDRMDVTDRLDDVRALVVFPDEFPPSVAVEGIRGLARHFARSWAVIVTRDTARFEDLLSDVGAVSPGRLFVLPRPVWGWVLLDRVLQPLPSSLRDTQRASDPEKK